MKIILDAGHRNTKFDYGASNDLIKESELALKFCKKLKLALENLGHIIYETRVSENNIITLQDRVKLTNNMGKIDLFLSIHINSADNKEANGVEVLHYQGDAEKKLAQSICDSICTLTGQKNRGAKARNDLYVLSQTKCKALLVECGFLSNTEECYNLCNSIFQDKIVVGILEGLNLTTKKEDDIVNAPYHKIPFSKIKKIDLLNVKGGITATEIMKKYNPDWLCNLALYDTTGMQNMTFLEDENTKSGSYFSADGIGFIDHKTPIWCTYKDACNRDDIYDYVSGSPVLVREGKPVKDYGNKYSSYIDGSHKRMAVGITSNKELVLLASNYSNTPEELRGYALSNIPNLIGLINCDGGGSVHLQNKSTIYKSSSRANCSWLLIWLEETTGGNNLDTARVVVEGKETKGYLINDTTYVPVRFIGEEFGATIKWDSKTKTVTIEK